VDCDPNQVTAGWAQARKEQGLEVPFEAIANPGEDKIIDVLDKLAKTTPFVIVDLEGTASLMMSRTMSRSDLTIIPMQASPVDAKQAARAVELSAKESAGLPRARENAEGYAYYVVKAIKQEFMSPAEADEQQGDKVAAA